MKTTDKILLAKHFQWQYKLDKFTASELKNIQLATKTASDEMLDYVVKKAGAPHGKGGWTVKRFLNQLEEFKVMNEALAQQITDKITGVGTGAFTKAVKNYEGALSFNGRVNGFNYNSLSPEQLKAFASDVKVGGPTLKKWVNKTLKTETQDKIRNEILTGAMKGDGVDPLIRRLRKSYSHIGKTPLETLTITHVQSANNHALQSVIDANSDIVSRVRWLATLDHVCCIICAGLDGQEWKIGRGASPLAHPRCRCVRIPVTKSYKELGLDMKELKQAYRPELKKTARGGRFYERSKRTFTDRFNAMSAAEKLDYVGPGRYLAMEKHGLDLKDLSDPGSMRIYRLSELPDVAANKAVKAAAKAKAAAIEIKMLANMEAEQAKVTAAKEKAKTIKAKIKKKKAEKEIELLESYHSPDKVTVFGEKTSVPESLFGKPLKKAPENKHVTLENEPSKMIVPEGKKQSAGIIMVDEDTGKIWLTEPKDHFGGYKNTFPKGTVEPGMNLQQTAIKEVWEETGLHAEITGYLGDFEKSSSMTRYYIGKVKGGNPTAFEWETHKVKLAPVHKAFKLLNTDIDTTILSSSADVLIEAKNMIKNGTVKNLEEGIFLVGKQGALNKLSDLSAKIYDEVEDIGDNYSKIFKGVPDAKTAAHKAELVQENYKKWQADQLEKKAAEIAAVEKKLNDKYKALTEQFKADEDLVVIPDIYDQVKALGLKEMADNQKKLDTLEAFYAKAKAEAKAIKKKQDRVPSVATHPDLPQAALDEIDEVQDLFQVGVLSKREMQEKITNITENALKPKPKEITPDIIKLTREKVATEVDGGKALSDLSAGEKKALANLKTSAKKGKVPKPNTNSMNVWEGLSAQAQEEVLESMVKKGVAVPDNLPLKPGVANTYVRPVEVPSVQKVKWLKTDDYAKYAEKKGSNKGGFYHHKNNPADRWYFKQPANDDIAKNEMLAGKLYEAAGVDVPVLRFVEIDGQRGIASKIIDGLEENADLLASKKLAGSVKDNFAVDAWLGNWDVVGMDFDNLLVKDGIRAIRIDQGGALRYRAMGEMKTDSMFGKIVGEIDSMRNSSTNWQTAKVFDGMTQEQIETGVKKVLSVSDDDIRKLVQQYGPSSLNEKNDLIEKLIARKADLQKRFPNVKIKDKPIKPPKDIGDRISDTEFKRIENSRINGYSVAGDKDMIEDQSIHFWHEVDKDGNPMTGATLKFRNDGSKKMDAMVANSANKGAAFETVTEIEKLNRGMIDCLKGLGYDAADNPQWVLREKDIGRAKEALVAYDEAVFQVKALVKGGKIASKELDDFTAHFAPWVNDMKMIAVGEPGNMYPINGMFKGFKPAIKAKSKKVSGTPSIVWEKKAGVFEAKEIKNGYATNTGEILHIHRSVGTEFEHYYETTIDGIRVRYFPDEEGISFAHKGRVDILTPGADKSQVDKVLDTIEKKLGVTTADPTALDMEELYLIQSLRHMNDDIVDFVQSNAYKKANMQKRVDALKDRYNKKAGYKITETDYYNPVPEHQTLDHGKRVSYRADLLKEIEESNFEKDFVLSHELYNGIVPDLERILNGGGLMAPTTDKLRRGFPWGGMSPREDMRTGGSSYFFTRVARRESVSRGNYEGLFFKPKLVARLDAVSYSDDFYGNVTESKLKFNRKTSLQEIRENARGWSMTGGNETIFKNSLSVLTDIDHIAINSSDYDALINLFKRHKIDRWMDGRKLTDVIKRI